MSRITLYTYEDIQQFNIVYKKLEKEGKHIYPFTYNDIDELLEEEGDKILDISALIKNLQIDPSNIIHAMAKLGHFDSSVQVVVREELSDLALDYFPTFFDKLAPLERNAKKKKTATHKVAVSRKVLYTYENTEQLEKIIEFADQNLIPLASSSALFFSESKEFKKRAKKQRKSLIDITSLAQAVGSNPQLIFHAEQILGNFPYFDAIISEEFADQALDTFRFLFQFKKSTHDLYSEISVITDDEKHQEADKVIRVIDLSSQKREVVFSTLSTNLIGHLEFKNRFVSAAQDFVYLNKLKERKVLSVFLLGGSGLGKTEVARIINHAINPVSPLAKINFGNYSSKDALNSLIGSPRGYIGSEDGELSIKIRRSKVGLLLCDEFEKASRPIFDFFLELLEEGQFTDSIAREFDLDGYIIVFTSNINEKQFYERIPPELRSRFDLVCEFMPLSNAEKVKYVEHQVNTFLGRLDASISGRFSEEDHHYFRTVEINSIDNLRDVKRMIQERVISRIRNLENI